MENKETKIKVSDKFVDIYRKFNVVDQVDDIKNLSQKEKYLLLTLCLDKFETEDPVVKFNFQPFREEVMEIFDIQDDKETSNPILKEIIKETDDNYINTDNLVRQDGSDLPEPLTREEVRNAKINIINN